MLCSSLRILCFLLSLPLLCFYRRFFFLCPPRVSTSVSFPGSFGFPLVPWFFPFSSFSLCIFRSSQAITAVAAENGAFGAATEEEDKGVPLVFH
ncbi:hypothetical protein NC653_026944 [Populus alba x Populus x berolinensis]|uniref:Uncharacterized protein n=1 Tax=Populus alba x Populus x berolinensis TaxID=444605 RepID=A0AAD6M4F7_9ROSI|nr:hypothetical protein NC653_026944 [Populus alba x Populus x berolinensis]